MKGRGARRDEGEEGEESLGAHLGRLEFIADPGGGRKTSELNWGLSRAQKFYKSLGIAAVLCRGLISMPLCWHLQPVGGWVALGLDPAADRRKDSSNWWPGRAVLGWRQEGE